MRRPFIAGNWKMNKTVAETRDFLSAVRDDLSTIETCDVAFCVPFLAIPTAAAVLQGTAVGVGAQNMYFETAGAYTGEIAPGMLTPFCQYVILGHSERRAYFGETDEGVNRKAKAALAHGLIPIICVGESLAQNEAGETEAFVSGQVAAAFEGISAEAAAGCVVAYEPIWAIGTGRSADADIAQSVIRQSVRDPLTRLYGESVAAQIRIQYGGSVKPHNIADYMAQPDVDGALVGGASLQPSFVDLVRNGA